MSSVEGHLQALLGCEWGRAVWTPDDELECGSRAERIVVVHGLDVHAGPGEIAVKLCERHVERISQETTPSATAYPCAVCGFEQTCGDPPGEDCHS